MPWTPLQSSNLAAYDYDAEMRVLHIRFQGGRQYSYGDVPADVPEGLASAPSPGAYFTANIKNRYRAIA